MIILRDSGQEPAPSGPRNDVVWEITEALDDALKFRREKKKKFEFASHIQDERPIPFMPPLMPRPTRV